MKALAFGFALLQAATGALVPPPGARYVCLLDPEVSSDRPIPCPVCGYDLIPEELARSGLAAFTCPEHREIQQSTPGKCPKCGRRLVVEDLRARPQVTYVCPMHPSVTSSFPGKCSRCSMDLVREDQLEKKSAAYRCPMHPEVVSGKPGKCSKCAMDLAAVDPMELVRFPTELVVSPARFSSGEKISLGFSVRNPITGETVTEFDVVHEKRFHLFIVSQDLEFFDHVHPRQAEDGSWKLEARLPRPGYYRLYSDFHPSGGTPQLIQKALVTADCRSDLFASLARLVPDTNPSRTVDGMRVTLKSDPASFLAGREATLTFALEDEHTGAPLTDLRPYLAAWGHAFVLNEDGSESIHCHPTDDVPAGAAAATARNKPEISFRAFFPKPGPYRVWTQFLRKDEPSTFTFTIEVKRLR